MNCPECSSTNTRTTGSWSLADGGRRSTHECKACQHRWSAWTGKPPRSIRQPIGCPACSSSHTGLLESRLCRANGTRRRRHICHACAHRWTTWDGQRPDQVTITEVVKARRGRQRRHTNPLSAQQVREALMALNVSHHEMARRLDRTPEAIRHLRYGKTHRDVHPEIARWEQVGRPAPVTPIAVGTSCYGCANWRDRCAFGFPDPLIEGPSFAADCSLYEPVSQSISLACPTSVQ